MNKKLVSLTILILMMMPITGVLGVKPVDKPGVEEYGWYLSGDVMPVPPYGGRDIPGSDTASKLLVNQPNGNVEVAVTGVMKGLDPYTTYQVFLSKEYPINPVWNIAGTYNIDFLLGTTHYVHDATLTQDGTGVIAGSGFSASLQPWTATGQVSENTIALIINYDGSTYTVSMTGTIAEDGSMSGDWITTSNQVGTWTTATGVAKDTRSWPGLFTPAIQPFTFTTDEYGTGSWHVNLRDEHFPSAGEHTLSVWINYPGATILVSENFSVIVE